MFNNSQKGVSLIITFFILTIILAVVLSISIILYREIKIIRSIGNSVASFYAADSGIEKVLYFDRKEKPIGVKSGVCAMCDPGNPTCPPDYPTDQSVACHCDYPTGADCDPSSCENCDISFYTNLNSDKDYYITVNVSTDGAISNLSISSTGDFKKTKRAIQVFSAKEEAGSSSGWLEGWSNRKKITIQNDYIDGDLIDFPLYVGIFADSDMYLALNNGNDIRFTLYDGTTLLKYEKESWEGGDGFAATADFWVKAPILTSAAPTDIYIYYGNPGAFDGQDTANVWDENFKGVWHLKDITTSTVTDSTSNNRGGTKKGVNEPAEATGKIGKGQSFDASNDYISFNPITLQRPASFTMWYYGTGRNSQYRDLINPAEDYGPHLRNNNKIYWYGDGTGGNPIVNIDQGVWYYLGFIIDNLGNVTYYINGVNDDVLRSAATSSKNWSRIGYFNEPAAGRIDEVRISNKARELAWVKFEYRNMAEIDNELIWGVEE